jgi:urease accessory protein
MTLRATSYVRFKSVMDTPWKTVVLSSSERHMRRKLIVLTDQDSVIVDFENPVKLEHGDCLALTDGRLVQIIAGKEELTEVRARDAKQLSALAWHIGNRHLEAQIEENRILIRRDHVIAHMLEHLGATVVDLTATFSPETGAYHTHGDHREP